MANIQKQFEKFHDEIRMDYEWNSELAEKRDIVLNKIAASLKKKHRPGFTQLLQGSYKMKTGVKPLPGFECDIDVGLRFVLDESTKAAEVRSWVFEAIGEHTSHVESKGPCIRVRYSAGYHLDLVIYSWEERSRLPDVYRLAHKDRGWVEADPPTLLKHVADAAKRFAGTEDSTGIDQLRRVIRYLKRWDDEALSADAAGKVSGLGYTLLAINTLTPVKSFDAKPDDLGALLNVATIASATATIHARKPTPEYEDLFAQLSRADMDALVARFRSLKDALAVAQAAVDPRSACQALQTILGRDFRVPSAEDTALKTARPAIISTSKSG